MSPLDATHDPALRSWVPTANAAGADFPIQNLPFGIFARDPSENGRVGVAIGDSILDNYAFGAVDRISAGRRNVPDGAGDITGRITSRTDAGAS